MTFFSLFLVYLISHFRYNFIIALQGTTMWYITKKDEQMFQSTFPQGERRLAELNQQVWVGCFNPRSRKGNDSRKMADAENAGLFQSTFPQGERHTHPLKDTGMILFQSTFPQGERPWLQGEFFWITCTFQSTFPQGERLLGLHAREHMFSFNPRSRKGNDSNHL